MADLEVLRFAGPFAAILLAACPGGKKAEPPSSLTYALNPATYTRGVAIAPNSPSVAGGAVETYTVAPALPSGLALDAATGVVRGTPGATSPLAVYRVTATNAAGSASIDLAIAVLEPPPSGIAYAVNPATYTRGVAIVPNSPSVAGGAVESYSVSPALPSGLALDAATGVISGPPERVAARSTYRVSAANAQGSSEVDLSIAVVDVPPSIRYPQDSLTYQVAMPAPSVEPTSAGGWPDSCSATPPLPDGLVLTHSCAILGSPTRVSPPTRHTISATNSGGSCTVEITIAVDPMPPPAIAFAANPVAFVQGMPGEVNAVHSGGPVDSCSVTPPLPAGLTLDGITCAIAGRPTESSPATAYTVAATNASGDGWVVLQLTVNPTCPPGGWCAFDVGAHSQIWGSGPGDVWAVGRPLVPNSESIFRWDGSAWSSVHPGVHAASVGGSGPDDVWIGVDYTSFGEWGTIVLDHWNGSSWSSARHRPPGLTGLSCIVWPEPPCTYNGVVLSVWSPGPGEVWASGWRFLIGAMQADGFVSRLSPDGSWTDVVQGSDPGYSRVWGSGPADVWMQLSSGGTAHWDGTTLGPAAIGAPGTVRGGWARAGDDGWAVGLGGAIWHWDGSSWTAVSSGTTSDLAAIWGTGSSDVWVVGSGGTILRWDGLAWASVPSPTTADLLSVWVCDSEAWILASGGFALRLAR